MIASNDHIKKEEARCPFYSLEFFPHADKFVPTDDNRCGLFVDLPFPCTMEVGGFNPSWRACQNHWGGKDGLRQIVDHYKVCSEQRSAFVPFDIWFEDMMGYSIYEELESF